jgi:hypothetical protein
MTTIIMKTSDKFKTHYNRELGKKYYCERDYRADVKKAGLEPYNPASIKKYAPKKYTGVSEDARRMINSVTYDRKGKPNIGDRYIQKLRDMGMKAVPRDLMNKTGGGFK